MTTDVIVVRAFSIGGVRQEPGSRVSIGDGLAAELISAGKAERAPAANQEPKAEAEPPAQSEPKAQPRFEPGPERPRPAPTPNPRPRKP